MAPLFNRYALFLALGMTFVLFVSYRSTFQSRSSGAEYVEAPAAGETASSLPQQIRSVDLNKTYTFGGERIPAENFDAMERLDRELSVNSYWHSSTLLNIKNANRYFPVIEKILAEEKIPDDFKYLAVAESNLRNVTSPAGAKGIWQFMKRTGQNYGLEINSEVDERYHIEKATRAACQYLKAYYAQFDSWILAAAAYNMGGPSLARLMEQQHANTYFDLNLNPETSRYLFRIVAIKEILGNPQQFGFYVDPSELYEPFAYTLAPVDTTVQNWGAFARAHDTNYRILKVYNPWLVSEKLSNPSGKTYEVKIPLHD